MTAGTITVTGPKSEMNDLATKFGGVVERDGLFRWKLTINVDVDDDALERVRRFCRDQGLTFSEGLTR